MYHAIEGAVGCGKSTTLNLLKLSNLKAIYYDEPYQAFCHFFYLTIAYLRYVRICRQMLDLLNCIFYVLVGVLVGDSAGVHFILKKQECF